MSALSIPHSGQAPIPMPEQVLAVAAHVLGEGWQSLTEVTGGQHQLLLLLGEQSPVFLSACYDAAVASLRVSR